MQVPGPCLFSLGSSDRMSLAAIITDMSVDDLKKLNKNKKLVKKLAKKYDSFLASEALIKQIPRLLGPGLSKGWSRVFSRLVVEDCSHCCRPPQPESSLPLSRTPRTSRARSTRSRPPSSSSSRRFSALVSPSPTAT